MKTFRGDFQMKSRCLLLPAIISCGNSPVGVGFGMFLEHICKLLTPCIVRCDVKFAVPFINGCQTHISQDHACRPSG